MQTKHHSQIGTMPLIRGNSYLTANMLSRRDWQERAIEFAERERAIRAAGLTTQRERFARASIVSLRSAAGSALIRLGARVQGARRTADAPLPRPAA